MSKWICSLDKTHVFEIPTDDFYCPKCPPFEAILIESDDGGNGDQEKEVGLSVILMDASMSMTEPPFKGSPLTRMRLVSDNAAAGIFDLQRMKDNPNAVVTAFRFDDRIELMFTDSVGNLIAKYKDVKTFANYIYSELFKMQQGTDINKALQTAYNFISDFMNKRLKDFPIKNYTPLVQRILTYNNNSVNIANVRVLIYTDGMQFDANENRQLKPNPFRQNPLPGLSHDIVIGAFFGQANDEGCNELQTLLSPCPIHNRKQFFLFDDPANIGTLKYLFRMASGASGFCPTCLEYQLNR